jgi:hypothetical protein
MSATLHFVNQLGHTLDVATDGADLLAVIRERGSRGWAPTSFPVGGIHLPYAMADTFDWSLIGARRFTMKDGNEEVVVVEHLGRIYTRRIFEANAKKKMQAAIKYSRGANASDPPAIVEGAEGAEVGKGYVTLAIFKGGAPVIREFTKQGAGPSAVADPPGDAHDQDHGRRDSAARRSPRDEAPVDPLALLTEGQRAAVLNKARLHGIDPGTRDGATLLLGMVRNVMPHSQPQLDAAHMPALMGKLAERKAA